MRLLLVLGLMAGLSPATQAADPPEEVAKLPSVGPDFRPTRYRGRVVGLTKTGMVVKPEGVCTEAEVVRQPDGLCKEVAIYRQDNTLPPREFVLADCLFPDRPEAQTMRFGHNATDVRLGDIVYLRHQRTNGVPVCHCLMIFRRPGGKVPLAIGDDKDDECIRWCTRRNAEQFIEEKGIPVLVPRLLSHFHP
jgi:hypothetical protein